MKQFNDVKITSCSCLEKEYNKWLRSIHENCKIDTHNTDIVDFGNKNYVIYSTVIYYDEDKKARFKSFCNHSKVCPYCGKPFKYKKVSNLTQLELF